MATVGCGRQKEEEGTPVALAATGVPVALASGAAAGAPA